MGIFYFRFFSFNNYLSRALMHCTVDHMHKLTSAGAYQPGKSQDFASVKGKRYIVDSFA